MASGIPLRIRLAASSIGFRGLPDVAPQALVRSIVQIEQHTEQNGVKQWPYQKRPKTGDDLDDPTESDKAFHDTFKPTWAHDGTLTHIALGNAPRMQGDFIANLKNSIVGEHKDVRFAKFSTPEDVSSPIDFIDMKLLT